MKKFRYVTHGSIGTWFCIQEKKWWGYKTISKYINSIEEAEEIIRRLNNQ